MTFALESLIKQASIEASRKMCDGGEHDWVSEGSRGCPMGAEGCGQAVYVCRSCGVYDCGEEGGPGRADCRAVCGESMMGWRNGPLDPDPDGDAAPL